jgi:hypothetical protein
MMRSWIGVVGAAAGITIVSYANSGIARALLVEKSLMSGWHWPSAFNLRATSYFHASFTLLLLSE